MTEQPVSQSLPCAKGGVAAGDGGIVTPAALPSTEAPAEPSPVGDSRHGPSGTPVPTNNGPTVLYEDAALIVAIKPAGILSAKTEGKGEKSLPELLCPDTPLFVVHRLDRPTAGVMVYAKTAKAAAFLQAQGDMEKIYLAVCEGVPAEKSATLCDLLFFDRAKDKSYIVNRTRRGVKEARLSYKTVCTLSPDAVGRGLAPAAPPAGDPAARCLPQRGLY